MTERADVVIVGAGQGGAQTAMALRSQKYAGSIVMIGDEPDLPYERPALSKEYLAGDKAFERMLLRPASFWSEKSVAIRTGIRVTDVDALGHTVKLSDGSSLGYGTLVWAAGGRPRRLACTGLDLAGVHAVRERADVDRMKAELATATRVVVVGAGYIGLEAAAVLRKKDKLVTVVEMQDRVLSRVAGTPLARFFEAEHRARGVEFRFGAEVVCIEDAAGRATGVRLANGEVLPADIVVVGIGIAPQIEPLAVAGAETRDGVLVDLYGATSLPDVYAIGDCAAHPNTWAAGQIVRLESVQNATDHATVVAKKIAGTLATDERYDALPWFWSNQYDLRLQTVGLFHGHDETIVRGDPARRAFSVVYLREGSVVALDCVNLTKDFVQGKALITSKKKVDRARLSLPEVQLKELAQA